MLKKRVEECPVLKYTKFQSLNYLVDDVPVMEKCVDECPILQYTNVQCSNIPNSSTKIYELPCYHSLVTHSYFTKKKKKMRAL